ncbi:MAG: hypothetical protein QW478_12555 [Candidatus Micrarchaeaceae archaeon]
MVLRKLGNVAVDSGQIIIVDPLYLNDWKANECDLKFDEYSRPLHSSKDYSKDFSYNGACHISYNGRRGGNLDLAVVFGIFNDGLYPVYLEEDDYNNVKKLIIDVNEGYDYRVNQHA